MTAGCLLAGHGPCPVPVGPSRCASGPRAASTPPCTSTRPPESSSTGSGTGQHGTADRCRDHRQVVEGVIYRCGRVPWRDLPAGSGRRRRCGSGRPVQPGRHLGRGPDPAAGRRRRGGELNWAVSWTPRIVRAHQHRPHRCADRRRARPGEHPATAGADKGPVERRRDEPTITASDGHAAATGSRCQQSLPAGQPCLPLLPGPLPGVPPSHAALSP